MTTTVQQQVEEIVRAYRGTHDANLESVGGRLDALDAKVVALYPTLDFCQIDQVSRAAVEARARWRRRLGAVKAGEGRVLKASGDR